MTAAAGSEFAQPQLDFTTEQAEVCNRVGMADVSALPHHQQVADADHRQVG